MVMVHVFQSYGSACKKRELGLRNQIVPKVGEITDSFQNFILRILRTIKFMIMKLLLENYLIHFLFFFF